MFFAVTVMLIFLIKRFKLILFLFFRLITQQTQNAGTLDISPKGLRVRLTNGREPQVTPFQNIAVWSAVKFVVSQTEGGAAFLPLITDPENIDKAILFKPLR